MPKSKNAEYRFMILDRCFSDYLHKYTIDDLLDKVNDKLYDAAGSKSMIMVRQLRSDINSVRKMLPEGIYIDAIPLDGKKCYYRYSDPDFSIYKNELSVSEVQSLKSTIAMLGKYRGLPSNGWLEEVISNLEYRFGVRSNQENAISFEQNENLKGLEFLSVIIDATVNHQPLEIHYLSFKGKDSTCVIHPYHVRQFNNRWFLFGMEEYKGVPRIANRPLDRIMKVTIANVEYVKNTFVDFSTYFDNIVGVTHPADDIEEVIVELRFDESRFPYVINKPIHQSQYIVDESELTIAIRVRPNKELDARIFSYGPQVEVLSPGWYRDAIAVKIKENYTKYFPVHNLCTELE